MDGMIEMKIQEKLMLKRVKGGFVFIDVHNKNSINGKENIERTVRIQTEVVRKISIQTYLRHRISSFVRTICLRNDGDCSSIQVEW